jgi:hypothetical protein
MVEIRIQHRAGRATIDRLLENLPPAVKVVEDSGELLDPWRGYKLCLEDLPEEGHVVILQDDTIVSRNFVPALELIAAANPDTPVSLFLSKTPKRTHNLALLRWGKSRYVTTHQQDLVHVVALLWPVHKAREFTEWIDENPKRIRGLEISTSDDAHVSRWMKLTGQPIRCTIPSIVEHPDDVPSVVNQTKVSGGKDAGRTAAFWIGDGDPLELDWSK